jgi:hypothetical protein
MSSLDWREWSASHPCRSTPGETTPGTHWIGGYVNSRGGLAAVEKRKISPLYRGKKPRIQPIVRHCTDWSILKLYMTVHEKIFPENSGRYVVERRAIWTTFLCVNVTVFSANHLSFQPHLCGAMSCEKYEGMDRTYRFLERTGSTSQSGGRSDWPMVKGKNGKAIAVTGCEGP